MPPTHGVLTYVCLSVDQVSIPQFDVAAPGATRFTYLQQAPDSPAFVVALADSPQSSFTLQRQPNGVHRFKVVGSNSGHSGPESAVEEVTVSVAAAA